MGLTLHQASRGRWIMSRTRNLEERWSGPLILTTTSELADPSGLFSPPWITNSDVRICICICPEQSVKLAVSTLDIVYFIHYLFPALGSELGIEVDNEIIEIAPIPTEDEDESEEEDPSDYNEYNDSNDISDEDEVEDEIDFDCPGSGFYASPTDCEKYYQCTADKTVHI